MFGPFVISLNEDHLYRNFNFTSAGFFNTLFITKVLPHEAANTSLKVELQAFSKIQIQIRIQDQPCIK